MILNYSEGVESATRYYPYGRGGEHGGNTVETLLLLCEALHREPRPWVWIQGSVESRRQEVRMNMTDGRLRDHAAGDTRQVGRGNSEAGCLG